MKGNKEKRIFVHYFPIYGCVSTGIIYSAIGVIALLSFFKIKEGGADESSLLEFLNNFLVGKFFVWIILTGAVSYVLWRIYEAYADPYDYGSKWKGIARRTGIGLSSIADAFIAYSAVMVLFGSTGIREDGDPEEERQMVGAMLQESWGVWLIVIFGVIILLTAVVQFYYGITKGYHERLDIVHFSEKIKGLIHFLAWVGYFARGIIIGIIGFFYIYAGVMEDPQLIVNTDKAFDFIGDEIGGAAFFAVAGGTFCYGLFMFTLGVTYDVDN